MFSIDVFSLVESAGKFTMLVPTNTRVIVYLQTLLGYEAASNKLFLILHHVDHCVFTLHFLNNWLLYPPLVKFHAEDDTSLKLITYVTEVDLQ